MQSNSVCQLFFILNTLSHSETCRNRVSYFSTNSKLVHVHTFHRHGDRSPWAPILTTAEEINFWKSQIPKEHYTPSDTDSNAEITSWKHIQSTLQASTLSFKDNNWDSYVTSNHTHPPSTKATHNLKQFHRQIC